MLLKKAFNQQTKAHLQPRLSESRVFFTQSKIAFQF